MQAVLSAPPDGYTVFIGSNSTLATNVALFKALPYDPIADFFPLSGLIRSPAMVIVPPASPYKTLTELLDAARKQPGKLNYASGSAGYQLMTESLAEAAGVKFFNVPYRGASEAVTAVAGGNANLAVVDITAGGQLARSGTVKALAVAGDRRSSVIPDVPTAKEAGVSNYTAYVWVAAMVSAKTPPPVTDKLVELFTRASAKSETKEYFASQGSELIGTRPGGTAQVPARRDRSVEEHCCGRESGAAVM